MKQKSIMKRSAFKSRRKIILYIIASILILGIVAGFTDPFITDNRKFSAKMDEILVMEAEPPTSGSPEDYDLLSNLKFAAYKLHHASFFRGETNGKTVADLGITTYTQNVHNLRVATGENIVFAETISSSSMKSVAEQKYADNGIIIFRPSTSVNGNKATFSGSARQMSYEAYSKNYGSIPNQLSKYIINEKTIKSVRDENARSKAAAKTPDAATGGDEEQSGGFDFYVPETLVADDEGNYTFSLTLDETESSLYYRNEVRTLAGADQNPKFYSVRLTVKIDKNWNPISVHTVENYDIAIPVLGAMNCTGTLTEVFTQIDDKDGVVPERDFFQPYVDRAKDDPNYVDPDEPTEQTKSAADYLAAAFADYLSGKKNLDLTADITTDKISAYDLVLSMNLGDMSVQAMLGELYVKYGGDKVNIKLNDINGYMSTADFAKLTSDERVSALLGGLGDLDITKLFGGDILGTVFGACDMTTEDGVTQIHMPFDINVHDIMPEVDKVHVDASIFIKDDGYVLQSIKGDITVLGTTVSVVAKPLRTAPIFPSTNGAVDLSGIVDFIPDLLATAEHKTFGISGSVTAANQTFDIAAYIDCTDGLKADTVKADITLSAMGLDVSVKYVGGTVYVGLGNIDARGTLDDLPVLMDAIGNYVDFDKYAKLLKMVMPESVNDIISMIRSLDVTDSSVTLGLNVLTTPISITLERGDGALSGFKFDMKFDLLDIKFDAAAELDITYPDKKDIALPDGENYLTFAELAELINKMEPYVNAEYGYDVKFDGTAISRDKTYSVGGELAIDKLTDGTTKSTYINAAGKLELLGNTLDIVYSDNTAYVGLAAIKAKLAQADADKLMSPVKRIIEMFMSPDADISGIATDALAAVKSVTVNDGALCIELVIDGAHLNVIFDPTTGKATVTGTAFDHTITFELTIAPAEKLHGIDAPSDAAEYIDLAELGVTVDKLADIIQSKSLSADITISVGGASYTASLQASFDNGISIRLTEKTLPLDLTVIGGKAYITLCGIYAEGTTDDITSLIDALSPVIPDNVRNTINGILGMTPSDIDIENTAKSALGAIKAMSLDNGKLCVNIEYSGITAQVLAGVALDNVYVNASVNGTDIAVELKNISAAPVAIDVPSGEFAKASDIISALKPVLPLINESALALNIDAEVYGVKILGDVYVSLTDGAIEVDITAGDVLVKAVVKDGRLYMSVGNDIKLSEALTEAAIMRLVDKLDTVVTGLKDTVVKIIDGIKSMTPLKLLNAVSLYSTESGFAVGIDLARNGLDISAVLNMSIQNGVLSALDIDCNALGISAAMSFDAVMTNGVLTALDGTSAKIDGIPLKLNVGIKGTALREVEVITGCAPLGDVAEYIEPIMDLIAQAKEAQSLTLDISALAVTSDNKQMQISGSATVNFEPLSVNVGLTLFDGTDAAEQLNVKFTDGKVYIQSGNIKLAFDINTDIERLYAVVESYVQKGYLPQYIGDEIGKLLGLKEGVSIFSDISMLIDRLKAVAAANGDAQKTVELLFASLNGLSGNSAVKTIVDMIRLFERDDEITVAINMLGMTFNVTPHIHDGELQSATLDTVLSMFNGLYVKADVTSYTLHAESAIVQAPADAADYVSIAEFVDMLNNAVNTLTSSDDDGNITFELNTFNFDYEIYKIETTTDKDGNTVNVKDESGRDKPLMQNGKKVIDKTVKVRNKSADVSALKGKFVKVTTTNENGDAEAAAEAKTSYKFNLEAHFVMDISSLTYSTPLTIDLYVINNDAASGVAFVDYMENNGNGERIYIDYDSVMEIVAAVMDILGVDDDTMELLLGDYRVDIDKTIFESMDISGIDKVRGTLNAIADAAQSVKAALADLKAGWDLVMTAGSTDGLRDRIDDIKTYFENGIDDLKATISAFKDDEPEKDTSADTTGDAEQNKEPEGPEDNNINGKLYKDIVNGVTIAKTENTLFATISNAVTVNTDGVAAVTVTQRANTIDSITVADLDVNTAKLNNFNTVFTAGQTISDIKLPDDYNSDKNKAQYSDFSNIKHLLFDVMNTANMLEFEMGDLTSDKTEYINLNVLNIINVNIKYSVKVKLIDQGEGANPRYKTAADIMLDIPGYHTNMGKLTTFGLAKCVTRIFFYDNVLYIHGVKSWKGNAPWVGSNYTYDVEYCDEAYTIDELMWMLGTDDGIERLFKDIVFKLLPLMETFVVNIHDQIINAVKNPPAADANLKTVAQIFKGYNYDPNTCEHMLVIGLKELALNGSLRDVTVKLCGENDSDDNILDNYIKSAYIETNFAGVADLKLNAKLNNVDCTTQYYTDGDYTSPSPDNAVTDFGRKEIASKSLSLTEINGKQYAFTASADGSALSLLDSLLAEVTTDDEGKITSVTNRPNGINWGRPWKSAYDASLGSR